MTKFSAERSYSLEGIYVQRLEGVARRLLDDKPMSADDRRDLASRLQVLIDQFVVREPDNSDESAA